MDSFTPPSAAVTSDLLAAPPPPEQPTMLLTTGVGLACAIAILMLVAFADRRRGMLFAVLAAAVLSGVTGFGQGIASVLGAGS